jgi:3-deoxy-D-manno-octulosonic-acid transferase
MRILYNIGIKIYIFAAYCASCFNKKALLWIKGQKNWEERLKGKLIKGDKIIWIHCASLGEFEQGRPVIEAIKKADAGVKIVLTFFSPSGYEIRKDYPFADCVCYLPMDTPSNARKFVGMLNPRFVIFVKYEFWNNYISEIHKRNISLFLISAIFRPEQHFFKWYGVFFRNMLYKFKKIFVQDERSIGLLENIGIRDAILAGDTRFDRVVQIAGNAREISQLEHFRGEEKLFLAGSSWKPDEEIITGYINKSPDKMKWVFAPHEIDEPNISRLEKLINVKHVRFSEYNESHADARVLIIDNIGMLSSAYKYAYMAAIGGGFGKGIHNVLEAACWGIPVMFGPRYEKFREAVELIKENGAKTFSSSEDFSSIVDKWLLDTHYYSQSADAAGKYISKNTGATYIILGEIL